MPKKPEGSKSTQSEISLLLDTVSRRIEEDELGAYSEFMRRALPALPDRAAYEQALLQYLVERFSIHARWHCLLVYNYRGVKDFYEPYLTKLIAQVLEWAGEKTSQLSKAAADDFRGTLRAHLAERKSHWKSAAMMRARESEARELINAPQHAKTAAMPDLVAAERTTMLQAYKNEGMEHGIRITDLMIAKAASPTWHERTPVQRWKGNDPRCTAGDDAKIRSVLKRKPHLQA